MTNLLSILSNQISFDQTSSKQPDKVRNPAACSKIKTPSTVKPAKYRCFINELITNNNLVKNKQHA